MYLLQNLPQRITDSNGNVCAGAKVYTYVTGTTTLKTSYTDQAGLVPHPNPIILGSDGLMPQIWLNSDAEYRIQVRQSDDTVLHSWDDISGIEGAGALRVELASSSIASEGSGMLGHSDLLSYATGTSGRKIADRISFRGCGCKGDGTDDTAALNIALSAAAVLQVPIDGDGRTFGVTGDITLPSWCWIRNAKFRQLAPNASNRRTLYQNAGTFCRLDDVTVNRNGDGSGGSLQNAAGIYLSNCPRVVLNYVEVYGNDFGNGIVVIDCDRAELIHPYVHDITGGTAGSAAITDDTIQGIWIQRGNRVTIDHPRVENLLNRWSGQAAFNRYTRGITVGGTKNWAITSPMVENVDQGIDVTGDENAEFFEVTGGVLSNCYTWGAKCANSVQNGSFIGTVAYRCGQAGFVASAPSIVMAEQTQRISFVGCRSLQTGFGGVWTAIANVAGFRVANTVAYPTFPRAIKFIGCSADGAGGTMEYGFFNDSTVGTTDGEDWVEVVHCDSSGETVAKFFGFHAGFARRSRVSSLAIPNGAWTAVDWDDNADLMSGVSSTNAIVARRSGIWQATAGVSWASNATGTRGVRVKVNGVVVTGSQVRITASDANQKDISTSVAFQAAQGDTVTVEAYQDSGGALNMLTGSAFRLALISAGQA